ncbi:hypothetical protein EYF80_017678 [Liparis tanakae]|uniref:Uncharacterized protein n=1 Tax=Liparis tanakae TaxID=230148 RepID=A0A4Z2I2V2_9TELE|nr:hypothetical protein EYF80_017678 [Liparis tanakae]
MDASPVAYAQGTMHVFNETEMYHEWVQLLVHRCSGAHDFSLRRHTDTEVLFVLIRGPLDVTDYAMQPWPGHYPGPPQGPHGYPQSPSYPQAAPSYPGYPPGQPYARPGDPRGIDSGYYPHPR